jgi:hypothetical protein
MTNDVTSRWILSWRYISMLLNDDILTA